MTRRRAGKAIGLLWLAPFAIIYGLFFSSDKDAPTDPNLLVTVRLPESSINKVVTPVVNERTPSPIKVQKEASTKSELSVRGLYVTGKKVALRDQPSKEGKILDRMNSGFLVEELERTAEWIKVRHSLTRQIGYISSKLLSKTKPAPKKKTIKPKEPDTTLEVGLTVAAIAALLVSQSVEEYRATRPCACPYNLDRSGRKCGKRSAYSKPGGASPLCYASDISADMIAAFRANQ